MPDAPPTLDDLRAALHRARTELACAEQIDNTERMQREAARWRENVAVLERQIAERESALKHTPERWPDDLAVPIAEGDRRVLICGEPPAAACRILAEGNYQTARRAVNCHDEMLAALKALLPEVDAEIEQRQSSGNDEYWAGLKLLSDQGHAAIAKAEGRA